MSAGSSPDTGKSSIKGFIIPITEPPVVEIDTEATAAYIRLRASPVTHTEPFGSENGFVMLDFDANGNVVGIEVVGQQEFSIRELIKHVPIQANDRVLDQTRYVAADLQVA
ncbi:MAG TPA: DUF2283 domain-containing protein [Chthoniobacterales bacterium]|nr:DUF2283 domain-containing protein [Chthoniobacterales bacterium]